MDGSRSDVFFESPNGSGGVWMALVSGDEESTTKSVAICIMAAKEGYVLAAHSYNQCRGKSPGAMYAMLSRK
jgi:hypothetical protein